MDYMQSNTESFKTPDLKFYSSARNYLKDLFKYRKSIEPRFSLDVWSHELGFKSHSVMYMVTTEKRNFSDDFIETFSRNMKYSESDKMYFSLLAKSDNSKTAEDKKVFLDKILENKYIQEQVITAENYEQFLTNKDLIVVRLILAFKDVIGTSAEVAKFMGISIEQANTYIEELVVLNLIEQQNSELGTFWKPREYSFTAPKAVSEKVNKSFHAISLQEASEKLQNEDIFSRFRSIYFCLPKDRHDEFLSEIEFFLTKMKNKYQDGKMQEGNLVKLNLQAYNVTK